MRIRRTTGSRQACVWLAVWLLGCGGGGSGPTPGGDTAAPRGDTVQPLPDATPDGGTDVAPDSGEVAPPRDTGDTPDGGGLGDTVVPPDTLDVPDVLPGDVCRGDGCTVCVPGTIDCPCLPGGECTLGVCIDDVCVDCERGALDCVCRANGTCEAGLQCADGFCVACEPGVLHCPCGPENTCAEGLVCEADQCVPDDCTPGALDCPCSDGVECLGAPEVYCSEAGICLACSDDVAGCPCSPGDICTGQNRCVEGYCEACPESDRPLDCPCDETRPCAPEFVCDADAARCREPFTCEALCLPFQVCDDALAGDPVCLAECVEGYRWDGSACAEDLRYSCDGAAGTIDLTPTCLEAGEVCVELVVGAACVLTCDVLWTVCALEHRACVPQSGADDAVCGACLPGYEPLDDGCAPNPLSNCAPGGALDSIAEICAERLMECVALPEGGAECGACLGGTTYDADSGVCLPVQSCGEAVCGAAQYCQYAQSGGPPACADRPCPPGQAVDPAGACVACTIACGGSAENPLLWPETIDGQCVCSPDVYCDYQYDGAGARCRLSTCPDGQAASPGGQCMNCPITCGDQLGETNRIWPETTVEGTCVCETAIGYYVPLGGAAMPRLCDEDRDGWINRSAFTTYGIAEGANDSAALGNFRCQVRSVDRFVLENEYGQRHHVSYCPPALVDYAPDGAPGCDPVPIALFEADRLDSDPAIAEDVDNQFPAYGPRKLRAAELNPLTKACVSVTADFNANGREDLTEEQPIENGRIPGLPFDSPEDFVFQSLAYFLELHAGRYEPPASWALPGRYVIAERTRCGAAFPVRYSNEPRPAVVNDQDEQYWRSCARNRRADYDYEQGLLGFDFAVWGCAAGAGSCAWGPALEDDPPDDLDGDHIPDHGLCSLAAGTVVPDTPWRGMNHHSQFQCGVVKNDNTAPGSLALAELLSDPPVGAAPFVFNECHACADGDADPGCTSSPAPESGQPAVAGVVCAPAPARPALVERVGFVAARYLADRQGYERGCVDESTLWRALCPGGEGPGTLAAGNPGNYGLLLCGCNRYYGGAECELPCPQRADNSTSFLHVGGRDRSYSEAQLGYFTCSGDDFYCQTHPPLPLDGFEGGRLGWWLCGEVTMSHAVEPDGTPADPLLAGSAPDGTLWQVSGALRPSPVRRALLTEPDCDPALEACWSVF